MKFLYQYKTHENEQREGVVSASSRDDVYRKLRVEGIRPFKVELAPGVWNRLSAIGKRGLAIVVLALIATGAVALALVYRGEAVAVAGATDPAFERAIASQLRRQPIGDQAVIEKGIRTGWASVFPEEGERFLASFAVPGVPAGQRNTSEKAIEDALSRKVEIADGDSIEAKQIKSMVEGMKAELRRFRAAGGSIVAYGRRLVTRQDDEIQFYNRVKNEIEEAVKGGVDDKALEALLDRRNAELRNLGIRLISAPETP